VSAARAATARASTRIASQLDIAASPGAFAVKLARLFIGDAVGSPRRIDRDASPSPSPSRARERRTAHERSKSPAHAFVVSSRRPRASRTHDDARACGDAPAAHFRLNGENGQHFRARARKTKSLAMGARGWGKRERARSDE